MVPMALLMRSSNFKLQASRLKLQAPTTRAASARQQRVQGELAEVICVHPQETYCAAHVRFSSKLPIAPTHPQETQTCAVLPHVFDSTNVRILQLNFKLPRTCVTSKIFIES